MNKVEALHEFHDQEFAQGWADRFVPTTDRIALFDMILTCVKEIGKPTLCVLELGIGPGFLAKHLLDRLSNITYEGLDYSQAMHNISGKRLTHHQDRVTHTTADLTSDNWIAKVSTTPDIIVSTWTLHDLFTMDNISGVYNQAYKLLPDNGILVNGDFIKPDTTEFDYEEGRLLSNQHLELLRQIGFTNVECIGQFEHNPAQPTTANNYHCFVGMR